MNIKSNKKLKIVLVIVVALIISGVGLFAFLQSQKSTQQEAPESPTKNTQQNNPKQSTEDRTYEATSEGQTITVPDNVDPSSIKEYRLVTENETFKIRELSGEYFITLYPIINRPDQSDMYQDQLREYKQNAINYLKNNNVDIQKVKLHYEPSQATNL